MSSKTGNDKHETQSAASNRMYTSRAEKYDDSHHPRFASWCVENMLKPQPGEHVLDLACGTGLSTFPVAEAVGPTGFVLGIDVSDGMLSQAQKKLEALKNTGKELSKIQLVKHSISDLAPCEALKGKEDSFDAITCISALVLLQEPWFVLRDWVKYLKPGGRLIVDVTHLQNLPHTTAMEMTYNKLGIPSPQFRIWAQSEDVFRRVLESSDLRVDEVVFQPNTGAEPEYYKPQDWEASWERLSEQTAAATLFKTHLHDKARSIFETMWAMLAKDNGMIEEIDGTWVARAYKASDAPSRQSPVISGSCACKAITWSSTSLPKGISYCHCSLCRKVSGAPFVTFGDFDVASITIHPEYWKEESSDEALRHVWLSPNGRRSFCAHCMSAISMVYMAEPYTMAMAIGSVDEDSLEGGWDALKDIPRQHIYTKDAVGWYPMPDDGVKHLERMKDPSCLFTFK